MTAPPLSDRARRVLAALVREYIETGEPVASAALTRRTGLAVSSATIRNVLAQLEDLGYVWQPHTSAGRVPTDSGYRFYVDLLLESRRARRDAPGFEATLRRQAGEPPLLDSVLSTACHVLSEASQNVGFAVAPADAEAVFRRIEFVPIGGTRVLVIVVTQNDDVWQKPIDAGEVLERAALERAAEYLNREFEGQTLAAVREAVMARLREERTLYDQLLALAFRLASSSLDRLDRPTVAIEGASSLLERVARASAASWPALRALLSMVEEKQRLVRLLDEYIDGPGLTIVIGAEHSDPELRPFSLIASTYHQGARQGLVGVIGPTRMRYSHAIDLVEHAARAVGKVLSHN
jgi:heat-inducible transcriptional repressor